MSKANIDIQVVKAIYVSDNVARHPVHGTTYPTGFGRPLNYGWRKPGDVFNVAVSDVIKQPDRYYAYPCNKPFIINGNMLENPCGERDVQPAGRLIDIPGIGEKIAEKLVANGIETQEDVYENLTLEVMQELQIPPRSRTAIAEWKENRLKLQN